MIESICRRLRSCGGLHSPSDDVFDPGSGYADCRRRGSLSFQCTGCAMCVCFPVSRERVRESVRSVSFDRTGSFRESGSPGIFESELPEPEKIPGEQSAFLPERALSDSMREYFPEY